MNSQTIGLERTPRRFFESYQFILALIAVGVALRVWQYLDSAALWFDEIMLARNLVDRPLYALIMMPLDDNQVAPRGFLLAEKSAIVIFGNHEYALRLFPLLCALLALFLFYRLARRALAGPAVPLAMTLFVFTPAFIRYGSEVKQYSSDIAAALLMTILVLNWQSQPTIRRAYVIGIVGAVVVFFSQAALFVLSGLGVMLLLAVMRDRNLEKFRALMPMALIWGIAALVTVIVSVATVTPETLAFQREFFKSGFVPIPLHSFRDLLWPVERFKELILFVLQYNWLERAWYEYLAVYLSTAVYAIAIVAGFWSLWRRQRDTALALIAPTVMVLAASTAHWYPFKGRLVLFLLPSLLIAAAEGTDMLRRTRLPHLPIALAVALLVLPLAWTLVKNLPIYRGEETRHVLEYVQQHRHEGDLLYAYWGASQAIKYYGSRYDLHTKDVHFGRKHSSDTSGYFQELDRFCGQPRVWVIFSHSYRYLGEQPTILGYLDSIGVRLDSVTTPGNAYVHESGAYLYNLSTC
jgi:4-amino-4-deoxy-L-arabinose transferase-like glycosyltransferase